MARKAKSGDTTYNARRREYRAAQRYLKKAQESSGATAARNRAIAKTHLQNALDTYDPAQNQKLAAPIVNIAAQLGIQGSRREYINASEERRKATVESSTSALEGYLKDPENRKQEETYTLIRNKAIGKRIMGGLVDVWRDSVKKGVSAEENRRAAEKTIFDYFKTDNWYDVINKIQESIGSDLFDMSSDQEIYDTVRIKLQTMVINNTLVA